MLLAIALFGLLVPNGLFLYWLFVDFGTLGEVFSNLLALGFMLDAFMAMALLAFLCAKRPPGPIRWPWFVVLSLVGGLGFGIPFYLWLNFRRSGVVDAGFVNWWRAV
jgi:hypothetical protein